MWAAPGGMWGDDSLRDTPPLVGGHAGGWLLELAEQLEQRGRPDANLTAKGHHVCKPLDPAKLPPSLRASMRFSEFEKQ